MNTTNKLKIFLALLAAFGLTVTITFGARRVLSRPLDVMPSDADLKSTRAELQATMPRLPKDTEDKLAAALYPEQAVPADLTDPFIDRAGLTNSPSTVKLSATGPGLTSLPATAQSDSPDRNARLSQWQQSVRAAVAEGVPLPPMTTAYLINEVAPTGELEISGRHSVFFYLDFEKRTITADVGAKFFDGVLAGVTSEGAQFRTAGGRVKLVPWSRKQDITNSMPGYPATLDVNNSPKQPAVNPVKPVSQVQPVPEKDRGADRYADLQEAVKDRYPRLSSPPQSVSSPTPANVTTDAAAVKETSAVIESPPRNIKADDAVSESGSRFVNFNHALAVRSQSESAPSPSPTPSPSPLAAPSPSAPAVAAAVTTPTPATTTVVPTPKIVSAKPAEPRKQVCDPSYRGERLSISNESDRPLSLLALVNELNKKYAANIVLDYDIQETPVRLTVSDTPWTTVLRSILDLNDMDMVCLDGGAISQIAKRAKIAQIADQRRKTAPIVREIFKLRYLQPTTSGPTNLAGQTTQTSSTGGANIQTLEDAIRDILKAGGDTRGEARRIPGRNEIIVAATQQQMDDVRELIARMDRPGYQVRITGMIYTANENRLRDLGSQLSVAAFSLNNNNVGGISTLPNNSNTPGTGGSSGTGGTGSQGVAGSNPGGIPGLLNGMRQPSNGLGAANPLVTLGGGMVFPSGQFALQITAAEQRGAVNIQSHPYGIVADGNTFDLTAGIQIPVVTTTIAGGAPFQAGQVQFIEASRLTQIVPQVAEDDQGKPSFVTLNLRLENNSVDTSLGTFNGIPGVNRQSLQTVLRLRNGETAVIGGLAADQSSNSTSKVPGLGNLPVIGNLFKRKEKQENHDRLYFAITVEVIPQDAPIPNFPVPADATMTLPSLPTAATPELKPRVP